MNVSIRFSLFVFVCLLFNHSVELKANVQPTIPKYFGFNVEFADFASKIYVKLFTLVVFNVVGCPSVIHH